jgi:hypothetical protein
MKGFLMKQNVSPGVAIGVILVVFGIAGFLLWNTFKERPRPENVGLPGFMQDMENKRAGSFKKKAEEDAAAKKAGKKPGGAAPSGEKAPKAGEDKASEDKQKPAEDKESKPAEGK